MIAQQFPSISNSLSQPLVLLVKALTHVTISLFLLCYYHLAVRSVPFAPPSPMKLFRTFLPFTQKKGYSLTRASLVAPTAHDSRDSHAVMLIFEEGHAISYKLM